MAGRRRRAGSEGVKDTFIVLMAALSIIMLSFFILLNSMASFDNTRKRLALGSLAGTFGILPEGLRPDEPDGGMRPDKAHKAKFYMPSPSIVEREESLNLALLDLEQYLVGADLADRVEVRPRQNGLEVTWASDLLFGPNSAQLKPSLYPFLDKLANLITAAGSDAVIEGHTDNSAVRSRQFSSNWELSAARAANVMKYLVSQRDVPVERIVAVGHGPYRPLVPNRTAEEKARNRRVSVLLVNR